MYDFRKDEKNITVAFTGSKTFIHTDISETCHKVFASTALFRYNGKRLSAIRARDLLENGRKERSPCTRWRQNIFFPRRTE